METANSNIINKFCIINIINNIKNINLLPLFLIKVINKWPAIILALNRIANVQGRIIFLIVSINTINGINILGVPWGTKWINILLKFLIQPNNIKEIHIIIENVNEKIKWLEEVKIYEYNPIKLFNIIIINKEINKIKLILLIFNFIKILNSFDININKNFKNIK